jgi:hypothetical protein
MIRNLIAATTLAVIATTGIASAAQADDGKTTSGTPVTDQYAPLGVEEPEYMTEKVFYCRTKVVTKSVNWHDGQGWQVVSKNTYPIDRCIRPCRTETQPQGKCFWDAKHMLPAEGRSYIRQADGDIKFITHRRAHRLLTKWRNL